MDPDSTCHPDADPDSDFLFDAGPDADPDSIFHKGLNHWKSAKIVSYSIHFGLSSVIDADPVPDPTYHFDAGPDFYMMRMRIRMRIHNTDVKTTWFLIWKISALDPEPQGSTLSVTILDPVP